MLPPPLENRFIYATVEAFIVNLIVDVAGISDRFASALPGTLFGLAFHPIKNRMEHLLRRFEHYRRIGSQSFVLWPCLSRSTALFQPNALR
jgi:hypothetical protein